ncbi:MAG: replicative DNA helicase [bacterium]
MNPTSISLEKSLPHNIEAEKAVLGAILLDSDSLSKIVDQIGPEDFYRNSHQIIYKIILELYESGTPIDLITLKDYLKTHDLLESIGGISYLTDIFEATPTSANIFSHATIVREKAVTRRLINVGNRIFTQGYEESKTTDLLLDDAERMIFDLAEKKGQSNIFAVKDIIDDSFEVIEKLYHNKSELTGVGTGFKDFDLLTSGLHKSDLIIIAARPSMGKTALCINMAMHMAVKEHLSVLFFSLEMSKEQLVMRMLSSLASVNSHRLRTGFITNKDWDKLVKAGSKISEASVYIDDTSSLSALDLKAKARRLKREKGLDIIMIDYLQLMEGHGRSESRQQEISAISRSLKGLAKELDVPLIALSQLSRAVENRTEKRPMLSDLRESGAIEQDADLVAFIYRPEVYSKKLEDEGIAELIIGKQRNGPIDTVKLVFLKEYTRFENYSNKEYN